MRTQAVAIKPSTLLSTLLVGIVIAFCCLTDARAQGVAQACPAAQAGTGR